MDKLCPLMDIFENGGTCPKALKRMNEGCRGGVKGERLHEDKCPWYIDSEEHGYCFWIYSLDTKTQEEKNLTEVAKLLKTSINNVRLIEIGALAKIEKHLKSFKTA